MISALVTIQGEEDVSMRVEASWTKATVDDALEVILPLESKGEYERACAEIAEEVGAGVADVKMSRGMARDGDPVNWLLWGLSLRIKEYEGPCSPTSRRRRFGPFTRTERMVVRWAVNGRSSKQKRRPDVDYVSRLLQRPASEVEAEMNRAGPARGRTGFFKR